MEVRRSVSVVWGVSFYPGDGEGEDGIVSRDMEEIELFSNTNIRENLWRLVSRCRACENRLWGKFLGRNNRAADPESVQWKEMAAILVA